MTPSSTTARRPTVDEWGVYDPQQAGLAALFTRLSATPGPRLDTAADDSAHAQPTASALPAKR